MPTEEQRFARRLIELKESFDQTFALPHVERGEEGDDFLIVGTEAGRFALRLKSLVGLESRRKVVCLPAQPAILLGLTGFQGQIVPVVSLASLVGSEESRSSSPWLAICKSEDLIALAFERLEGSAVVLRKDIFTSVDSKRDLTKEAFRTPQGIVPILDAPALLEFARKRLRSDR